MNCKVEKTEKANEVKLEITIEAEKFENAMKKVYFQNAKYFNITGFRKGKAPMNIVEKYYGAQIFYEDAFNEVATEAYDAALAENKIEAVSRPEVDIIQMEKGKDVIFTAVVQTKPEVELGKYKGIEIPKIEYTVEEKDIEHELGHMQEHNSRLVTIEDRALENGDISTIDFEGFVDGVAFEGGKAEGHELEIGSGSFIPGFEDQLVGMKIDEEKDIKVTFPKEYFSKDLAGKDATFKVKLHSIKEKELPKLDDEFAKDASEFDTLAELKDDIKKKLQSKNDERAKYELEEEAIKKVCDEVNVNIPSGMIDSETDRALNEMNQRLQYQGLNIEQYFKMMGQTEAQVRNSYKEQSERQVKSRLVLDAIVKEEKLEASDKELEDKYNELAEAYKGSKIEDLKKDEKIKEYLIDQIKTQKAIDIIVKNAKIVPAKKEKADKKEEKNEKDKNTK